MELFCFSSFARTVKRYAINPSSSDEDFIREMLTPLVTEVRVKNRFGKSLELDKTRVSRLLNQKDDVPSALRNALSILGVEQRIACGIQDFLSDFIEPESVPLMYQELRQLYSTDGFPGANDQTKVMPEYSLESFIYLYQEAIRVSNRLANAQGHCVWSCGANSICLIEGDLFSFGFGNRRKQKTIVVIPVNTGFDTHISWKKEQSEYPLVSEKTLHGAWLKRWEDAGHSLKELEQSIHAQLSTAYVSKNGTYPYGTIVSIECDKATYYLLAISEFDAKNRAQSNPGIIQQSVVSLLEYYDVHGQGYPLYLPLLGTGRSRASLQYAESYALICKTMVEHSQNVQGEIYIVATKEAMEKIRPVIGGNE